MLRMLSVGALILAVSSLCPAALITGVDIAQDNDGAIDCDATTINLNQAEVEPETTILGDQFWGPGHMVGTITTNNPDDPILRLINYIDNESDFAWTGYTVNVLLSKAFTLEALTMMEPDSGWSGTMTQPELVPSITIHETTYINHYMGTLELTGTPVDIHGTLGFSYKINFTGDTSYAFVQEMIPTPEPMTLGLLAAGGLGLIVKRRTVRS
jgi:hypothetical protein